MSDMSLAGPQNGAAPDQSRTEEQAATHALIYAVRVMAQKAAGSDSAAEAKDFAAAGLQMSQAIVILDPSLTNTGVPLAHDVGMEQLKQDGAARLQRARDAAAAPTPGAKRP